MDYRARYPSLISFIHLFVLTYFVNSVGPSIVLFSAQKCKREATNNFLCENLGNSFGSLVYLGSAALMPDEKEKIRDLGFADDVFIIYQVFHLCVDSKRQIFHTITTIQIFCD